MTWAFTSGLPETGCGLGSKLSSTLEVRRRLPELFRDYGIRTVIDVPCGDFNWMSHVDLSQVHYVGADVDVNHLALAESRYCSMPPKSKTFIFSDLFDLTDKADLVICRDFLQHLPNWRAMSAIKKLRSVGTYLLLTSHNNSINSDIEQPGGFRPLNLMTEPFNFPPPIESIDDSGRILGLWK